MAFRYDIKNKKFVVKKLDWQANQKLRDKQNTNRATGQSVVASGIEDIGPWPGGGRSYKQTVTKYEQRPSGQTVVDSQTFYGRGSGGSFTNKDKRKAINDTVAAFTEHIEDFNKNVAPKNQTANKIAQQIVNQQNAKIARKKKTNAQYDQVLNQAKKTKGGDYLSNFDKLKDVPDALKESFKDFYRTEKLQTWKSPLKEGESGVPYGNFDGDYYGKTYAKPNSVWNTAEAKQDLDITERYGTENNYYLYHYLSQGKKAGNRGNAAEATDLARDYVQKKPTDKELQDVRKQQLGIDIDDTTSRILSIPEVAAEWEKAKEGDEYWKQLGKDNYLDLNKEDEFVALFRMSERDKDKDVKLVNDLPGDNRITELEDAITGALGDRAITDTKKFGGLAQDVLTQTVEEIKKARGREAELEFYRGFGGFDEIMSVNDQLTDSLLGDTGIGGILGFTGDRERFEEGFRKDIEGVTGISRNAALYNWQQWFDTTLKERYDKDLEVGLTRDEATEQIKIEKEFAQNFYDKYLKERFDTSRSMDEFVEYLDVRQEEKNPFQTQDTLDALATIGELRSKKFLDDVQAQGDKKFNSNFYFNPEGNSGRADDYATQKKEVAAAWKQAKTKPDQLIDPSKPVLGTWAQQAYRFGRDLNNKDDFARMHYQIIGKAKQFDEAKDVLNASIVTDFIAKDIIPKLDDEVLKSDTVFGQFIMPEEFADELLEGLDPNNKEEWQKVLEDLGLEDFEGTIDELKGYIVETLRTGSAQTIRENIKYLNENRKKPTQERLGATYIERAEDYKPEELQGETELYKVFQNAGFKGTEDEFYENFMPDLNREDAALLTSAGRNEKFSFDFGDYSDPFASLASVESLLGDDEDDEDKNQDKNSKKKDRGFFDLSLDIDEDPDADYKSSRGKSILGDFTSGFNFFK